MKGALWGLAGSALFLVAAASHPATAWAQKGRRVVVEQFSGPGADRFRQMVLSVLNKQSVDVVPDKKVVAIEADLGLIAVSDAYVAVARELKLAGFVSGKIDGGKKPKARLSVRDAEGGVVGSETWSGANTGKLLSAIDNNLSAKLGDLLDRVKSGSAAPPATARTESPAKPEKAEKAEKVGEKVGKEEKAEKAAASPPPEKEKPKKVAAAEDDDFAAPKRKSRRSEDEDSSESDEPSLSESADDRPDFVGVRGLDLALGVHVYSRNFTYNELVVRGGTNPQNYRLPRVPAPNLAFEYFVVPYAALTGSFEYSVALFSKDDEGSVYKTSAMSYSVGAKGQYPLGPALLNATVAYANQSFKVVPAADDDRPPQVAGVSYNHIRAGLGGRMPLTDTIAVTAGAAYLHVLAAGEIISDDYFPYATAKGGDAFAGVAVALPWMKGLEARGTLDFRRFVFDMRSAKEDPRAAGGATDQYFGVNLAVAYRSVP